MKWNEGLRRLWVVWRWAIGVLTVLAIVFGLAVDTDSYSFLQALGGVLLIAMFGVFLAYLPRVPWLAIDLVRWVRDGFKEPPAK